MLVAIVLMALGCHAYRALRCEACHLLLLNVRVRTVKRLLLVYHTCVVIIVTFGDHLAFFYVSAAAILTHFSTFTHFIIYSIYIKS